MKGLTFIEPDGTWGIVGMNESNKDQKMYSVACKLRDYEKTGLQPDEVERLKNDSVNSLINMLEKEAERIRDEAIENIDPNDSLGKLLKMKKAANIETAIKVLGELQNRAVKIT